MDRVSYSTVLQCHLRLIEDIFQVALWYYFGTLQLLSDIYLIALPIYMLFGLQLSFGR